MKHDPEGREATDNEANEAYQGMIDRAQWTGSGFPLRPASVRVHEMNQQDGTHHMVVPVNEPEGPGRK